MDPNKTILSALSKHLVDGAIVDEDSIAFPNTLFTPVATSPYLQAWFLPAEPFQATLGENGVNIHSGVFQVDVNVPAFTGTKQLLTMCGSVVSLFKRGTVIVYGGLSITITKAFESGPRPGTKFTMAPVTIVYRVFAAN